MSSVAVCLVVPARPSHCSLIQRSHVLNLLHHTTDTHKSPSLPVAAKTACPQAVLLQALAGAQLEAGQRVLIHAGSGGVGTMAIQIAKLWGAHVVTTCSAGKSLFVQVPGIPHMCSLHVVSALL